MRIHPPAGQRSSTSPAPHRTTSPHSRSSPAEVRVQFLAVVLVTVRTAPGRVLDVHPEGVVVVLLEYLRFVHFVVAVQVGKVDPAVAEVVPQSIFIPVRTAVRCGPPLCVVDHLHTAAVVLHAVDVVLYTAVAVLFFQLGAVGIVGPFDPVAVPFFNELLPCVLRTFLRKPLVLRRNAIQMLGAACAGLCRVTCS